VSLKKWSTTILIVAFLAASLIPIPCMPALAGVTTETREEGAFARLVDFARKYLLFQGDEGSTEEEISDDGNGVFSKNPLVYIAAFWTEIANAPSERGFFERILAFLEAVRKNR